jgi:hypothetical protein
MSLDFFKDPPSLTDPFKPSRFNLAKLTPFGGRLITEVIGCNSSNPVESISAYPKVAYHSGDFGYDPKNAKYKFIRQRVNNGILPLHTIRGGGCKNGREDGLCALGAFLNSQKDAYAASNYNYACFGNYTVSNPYAGNDFDGTIKQS